MNTTDTALNGWSGSYMRNTICPAMKAAFSNDLQTALGSCTKYTHNTKTGSISDLESNVTGTTDSVFLLAEYEVYGTKTDASSYEQNKQTQYDYFSNGNSAVFYKHNAT